CGAQRPDGGGQYWMNFGRIASGGQLIETSVGASLTLGGVWQNASDRHRKTDFAEVDGRAVLEKVLALPVRQWRYTNEAAGVKHLGPTAQDFRAAFGLGTDDQSIGTVDADGGALAAIQGLNQKLEARSQELGDRSQGVEARMRRLEAALKEREAENARLREAVTELQALVRALAAQDNERAR
ncbi:MAG: tail fiber domain-containing protein, partial [Verrucomicrobiae bacterium]|nr:tail fiber domain-containing protein [Verrucomicrobiae bacterium]